MYRLPTNADDFQEAINLYSKAINEIGPANRSSDFVGTLHSNRSVCRFQLKDFVGALEDAEVAIKLRPIWGRGYLRKACALLSLSKTDLAIEAAQEGLKMDPDDSVLREFFQETVEAVDESDGRQPQENGVESVMEEALDKLKKSGEYEKCVMQI